jgi:hypothetical protein
MRPRFRRRTSRARVTSVSFSWLKFRPGVSIKRSVFPEILSETSNGCSVVEGPCREVDADGSLYIGTAARRASELINELFPDWDCRP